MKEWFGSAAVCINDNNEVLMVKSYHSEAWALPSGGIEEGETPEQCCVREVMEETGYVIEIEKALFIKETVIDGIKVKTHYFSCKKIGESHGIQDPDSIIEAYSWKTLSEVETIHHAYPEDVDFIISQLKKE